MAKEKTRIVTRQSRIVQQEKQCPVCGNKFWGAKVKKFCSLACAQKDSYQHHAEERRKARMDRYYAEKKAAAKK